MVPHGPITDADATASPISRTIDITDTIDGMRIALSSQNARYSLALLAGLSLAGTLAACSPATPEPTEAPEATDATSIPEEPTETAAPAEDAAAGSTYTDGSYTASADYQSPNGTESVEVTITLADDVVSAVEVVGSGDNPDSRRYQGMFIDNIASVVVGKEIDSLAVDKVAGSSLTSGGFNDAVEAIKADAAA